MDYDWLKLILGCPYFICSKQDREKGYPGDFGLLKKETPDKYVFVCLRRDEERHIFIRYVHKDKLDEWTIIPKF